MLLGTIVGIHRDPDTGVAKWAVVESGNPQHLSLLVPFVHATDGVDGFHVPYGAAEVRNAPTLNEPTCMHRSEEARLLTHYGFPAPAEALGASSPKSDSEPMLTMIRSEEHIVINALEWRPFERVRIRKVIRTEEVTQKVTVHREELVVDEEPISALERLEVSFGTATTTQPEDINLVLHREELVIEKRVVPYERVRVRTHRATQDRPIETTLRKERIDVEREPVRRS